MHAERSALADQAVEQAGCFLSDLVVLDEELLELIDDEQYARRPALRHALPPGVEILSSDGPEAFAAQLQLRVEPLQDAQAEFALALDGDHAGVRQLVDGVGLELDALLEVH